MYVCNFVHTYVYTHTLLHVYMRTSVCTVGKCMYYIYVCMCKVLRSLVYAHMVNLLMCF